MSVEVRPPIMRLAAQRLFNRKTNQAMEEIAMRNVNQDLCRLRQPNLLRFRPAGDAIRAISGICYRLWMIEIRGYIDTQGRSPYARWFDGLNARGGQGDDGPGSDGARQPLQR